MVNGENFDNGDSGVDIDNAISRVNGLLVTVHRMHVVVMKRLGVLAACLIVCLIVLGIEIVGNAYLIGVNLGR